ncbi:MAG: hypothetical protein V3U10_02675 [Bacteroidota bacterium]
MSYFRTSLFLAVGCAFAVGLSSVQAQSSCEVQGLTSVDEAIGDQFGTSVSIGGDFAVVGARYGDTDEPDTGAAYVFQRIGLSWGQVAKLTASDGASGDWFGSSAVIKDDIIVVGAPLADTAGGARAGRVYVFERPVSGWEDMTETSKLTASDGVAEDWFGAPVAVSGNFAIIGAHRNDEAGSESGAAYIFKRDCETNNCTWTEFQKLTASDAEGGEAFGAPVSIDGDFAIVGAWNAHGTGDAYVFQYLNSSWSEVFKLKDALEPGDLEPGDEFGFGVSLHGDVAIVSANRDNLDGFTDAGSAYVFERSNSTWTKVAHLTASNPVHSAEFGNGAVWIGDNMAVVGAARNGVVAGSAYVFKRPDSGWSDMTETTELTVSDPIERDRFGNSVSGNDGIVIVGAALDDKLGPDAGAVYVFAVAGDCNENEAVDACEILIDPSLDQNESGILDECEDLDGDGVPDDEDNCPDSDLGAVVVIDECETGVENQFLEDGCTMADTVMQCSEGVGNHGAFVRCVAHLTNFWKCQGLIAGDEKGAIQSCAGQADIP